MKSYFLKAAAFCIILACTDLSAKDISSFPIGKEWLDNRWFRLGTSRLANLLLSDIKGEEMKFF